VRLLHVPIESFQVELKLTKICRLELLNFQFKGDQGIEGPIEEQKINCKVSPTDLEWILCTAEAEIATQFDQELFELCEETLLQFVFRVPGRKVQEFQEIGVFEDVGSIGLQFSQRC
jgi:hypothetical protein